MVARPRPFFMPFSSAWLAARSAWRAALEHVDERVVAGELAHSADSGGKVGLKEGALPAKVGAQVELDGDGAEGRIAWASALAS